MPHSVTESPTGLGRRDHRAAMLIENYYRSSDF
ncbi:hypothetical protein V525_05310 [Gordonia alkanivorans CGMCC 6845]|uniref:Uncharacterized protein n=1 Tax=Gordonia alkanivorans CGMCC 6845 TaxID=1423140 RepID=W9DL25_9ACTN|nr:hypothetical protein V525_05310 [Gordonia alkanivorans CGMCC 6845]